MRTVKWNAFLSGLCGFVVALGVMAASAHADVTTEKGASILVFPKVRADGTFDTVIQITNTGNSMVHARCYYVNATLFSSITGLPCFVPGNTCIPSWQETDFTIWLTKQQPTHWLVSTGRFVYPFDWFGTDGSGFDPGHVPPVTGFQGELKCIEVSESGEPVTGNHLKGEATLIADAVFPVFVASTILPLEHGDVAKYNAIGIQGNPDAQPSNPLLLDDTVYDACPEKLILNHVATLAPDEIAEEIGPVNSTTFTELTLVPCTEDFENQVATSVTIQFLVYNEFEERFSASTTVNCYLNAELTDIDSPTTFDRSIFSIPVLGTDVATAEITPVTNADGSRHAVIGVVQRFLVTGTEFPQTANSAAYNIHTEGSLILPPGATPDQIRLTELEF